MFNQQKKKDLNFGFDSEKKTKPILEKFFNIKLETPTNKFSTYDYFTEDKKIWFELKSRRTYKTQYPDVMIGANKINKGLKLIENGCDVYICWKFIDKLCYYKLDKSTLNEGWKRQGGRTDRGKDEIEALYYIPTHNMVDIKKF